MHLHGGRKWTEAKAEAVQVRRVKGERCSDATEGGRFSVSGRRRKGKRGARRAEKVRGEVGGGLDVPGKKGKEGEERLLRATKRERESERERELPLQVQLRPMESNFLT